MIKILSIKKRNLFACWGDINEWKVKVDYNGQILKLNCWAGCKANNETWLIEDIQKKINDIENAKKFKGFSHLEGKEI